jgi:hypothetical protein
VSPHRLRGDTDLGGIGNILAVDAPQAEPRARQAVQEERADMSLFAALAGDLDCVVRLDVARGDQAAIEAADQGRRNRLVTTTNPPASALASQKPAPAKVRHWGALKADVGRHSPHDLVREHQDAPSAHASQGRGLHGPARSRPSIVLLPLCICSVGRSRVPFTSARNPWRESAIEQVEASGQAVPRFSHRSA